MANLIASWQPDNPRRVVIGAHYDTRPHPDQEVLPERHNLPFVGANDPASGIAVSDGNRQSSDRSADTDWGVDLVLFDGEELVFGNNARVERLLPRLGGVRARLRGLVRRKRTQMRYENGIVLDHGWGPKSQDQAGAEKPGGGAAVDERIVGGRASRCASTRSAARSGREVKDDHLALIEAGIPTVDLIDFDYPVLAQSRRPARELLGR